MTSPNKTDNAVQRGRPPLEIDWGLAEKLAQIACTDEEIAAIVGVSLETFKRRKRDPEFAEMLAGARAKGKGSLRRMQWQAASAGSIPMMIFLGKNLLGQRDRFDEETKENAAEKAKEIAAALKAMVATEADE
ncbi:hypothetical protein N825_27030 [Skermanella stibiiresistens SB22]|uniref:Uncharacterized protein n=1 Tax=Skermanella stibiiresistens SB22 TaxID=1385369 RepID=W9GVD2_9PROT|nr:hypothetical protein [Skermanella stibiiresistens]EWY36402.1 hypothetical protein N825_27030 [Skermanella stibiiresistens SB22]